MSRRKSHGSEILRRFIQQVESYNRCMFPKKSNHDRITQQILFCQNQIENFNISSTNKIHTVDIISNEYQYENSSLKLNLIQQCSIISIISPHAFTIQLNQDLIEYEKFSKIMNDYYNSIDDLHIPQEYLRKNLLCVTWDENRFVWNRSQILEYDLINDTVNVFFVDLNSWEEHVSRSRIRFILTKYSSQFVSIITCRLASICSININQQWNDVSSKTFQNVIENCQCDIEPLYKGRDQTFYVNLFALHDEAYVCINDFLIHCKMAKPIDDISKEKDLIYMLDENDRPMHPIMSFYWQAEEFSKTNEEKEYLIKEQRSLISIESETILTKMFIINENNRIIFARFQSYIMLPWFSISKILNISDEEKIRTIAYKLGFKPIIIDSLSHSLLYSNIVKLINSSIQFNQLSLYSIDCVRKILDIYQYKQEDVYHLLDRARFAEANNDSTFWKKSFQD